jgi:outer membrane receptor protein involved in Fe transport
VRARALATSLLMLVAGAARAAADEGGEGGESADDGGESAGGGDAPAAPDAAAEEPEPDALAPPAVVVTPDRAPSTTFLTARFVDVLDERALAERPPATVAAALIESGAFVPYAAWGGGAPVVRGLGSPRVLVLVDGVRVDDSTGVRGAGPPLALLDPAAARRVELLHGPASVLWGSGALGGVAHVVTRSASAEGTYGVYTPHVGLRRATTDAASAAAWPPAGAARADFTVEHFGVGLLGGASWRRFEDLRGGRSVGLQPYTGWAEWDLDSKLTVGVLNGQRIELGLQAVRAYDVPDTDACRRGDCTFAAERFRTLWYARWQARDAGPLAGVLFDALDVTLSLHDKRAVVDLAAARDAPPERRDRTDVLTPGLTVRAARDFGEHHALEWGLELYADFIRARAWTYGDFTARGSGAVLRDPDALAGLTLARLPERARTLSGALFARWDWNAADRLDLDAGARLGLIAAAAPGMGGGGALRPVTALEASAVYRAHEAVRLALNVAEGMRAPTWDEQVGVGARAGAFDVPAAGRLRSERALTVDFGPRVAAGRVALSMAGFASRLDRLVVHVPGRCPDEEILGCPAGATSVDGRPVLRTANARAGFVAGVEASGALWLGAGFRAFTAATWTWGELRLDARAAAQPLAGVPPLYGLAGVGWTGARGRAFADLTLRWALPRRRLAPAERLDALVCPAGPDDCAGPDGYAVLSAHAGWEMATGVRATLTLENVGDAAWSQGGAVAGPGASVVLGLDLRYAL